MQMARVIGDVVATYKDPAFEGTRLMLVQPIGADGRMSAVRWWLSIRWAPASARRCFSFAAGKPAFRASILCPPMRALSASSITLLSVGQ